jgi:stage IV sporulation protein FB
MPGVTHSPDEKGPPVLFEPSPTSYDVRFRLLGVPVRVHPMFWLMGAVLGGLSTSPADEQMRVPIILIWVACVFVSVLVHELGHVLMGRLFGSDGTIVLYSFGGLAVGSSNVRRRWQRILVLLAGPFAQFGLLAAVLLAGSLWPGASGDGSGLLWRRAVRCLVFVNLAWPLLNLLPVWPLDGGQVVREVLGGLMPSARAVRASLVLSAALAGVLAANALAGEYGRPLLTFWPFPYLGGTFIVFLFAMLALQNFQTLQSLAPRAGGAYDDRWEM